MAQRGRLVSSNRLDTQGSGSLIVRPGHIKYQSTVIESQTTNSESLILPEHFLSEEAKLVFRRIEQVTYGYSRSKELEVGRSGHVQGMGSKYLESAESGEPFTNLEFCCNSALSENVLRILGGTFEYSGMDSVGFHKNMC